MTTKTQLEQYLKNPHMQDFLDLISRSEGTHKNGYRTAFGGGRIKSLHDHPRYLKTFTQTNGKKNKTSAAGRYQFMRKTWDNLVGRYGFDDFGKHNQDLGAVALLVGRGAVGSILKGDWRKAVKQTGGEWASFASAPAHYHQNKHSWKTLNGMMSNVKKGKYRPNDRQQSPLFYGDSIAHGYRGANKGQGITKVGANPKTVLKQLAQALRSNPNAFKNQNITLSSGLSNNVQDYGNIEKQLQLLKNSGANVQLLGVSNQFNLHGQNGGAMNSQLADMARQYGASFNGGFESGKDGVHPASYRNYQTSFAQQAPTQRHFLNQDEIANILPQLSSRINQPQRQFLNSGEISRLLPQLSGRLQPVQNQPVSQPPSNQLTEALGALRNPDSVMKNSFSSQPQQPQRQFLAQDEIAKVLPQLAQRKQTHQQPKPNFHD